MGEDNKKKEGDGGVGQEQIHDLLFSEKLSWQAIIYDLINTEQLDPWNINVSVLTDKYLEKIKDFEDCDFFVSSKVLLAAALLLRIKSEILLNRDLPGLDDILFGKEEQKKYIQERIELDEDVPGLVPRTPLPRYRKVTLPELMSALGKAIKTESRRIKRVVVDKQREMETNLVMPKNTINIRDQIKEIYGRLRETFSTRKEKLAFSEFAGTTNEERVATFIPLLHLDNQNKVFLDQEGHFDEIWIWLKKIYDEKFRAELEEMRAEVEAELEESSAELSKEEQKRAGRIREDFKDPLGDV